MEQSLKAIISKAVAVLTNEELQRVTGFMEGILAQKEISGQKSA